MGGAVNPNVGFPTLAMLADHCTRRCWRLFVQVFGLDVVSEHTNIFAWKLDANLHSNWRYCKASTQCWHYVGLLRTLLGLSDPPGPTDPIFLFESVGSEEVVGMEVEPAVADETDTGADQGSAPEA